MLSKVSKAIIKAAAVAVACISGWLSVYKVDQTEHAVITSFGNPIEVVVNPCEDDNSSTNTQKLAKEYEKRGVSISTMPGLHFKMPWHAVNRIDKRLQRWDGYAEEGPTRDKKNVWIDTTARFYVSDPLTYFRKIQTERLALLKLSDILDSTQRDAITGHNLLEIVRTDNRKMEVTEPEMKESVEVGEIKKGRDKIMQELSEKARSQCSDYGIQIHNVGVLVKGLKYVESVKQAIEERMKSERNRIAEKYTSEGEGEYQRVMGRMNREVMGIKSEGYRRARDIEGAADAEVTKIYAEGFTNQVRDEKGAVIREEFVKGLNRDPEFYSFMETLGLYKTGFGGPGKVSIVIGTDNPLMIFLKGYLSPDIKIGQQSK